MPSQEYITVRGARANNLRGLDLDIPKRQLVVFTGVSGSGKSSLVFDTLAAEAQRQLNDTLAAFVRNRMPHYGRPEADHLDGLSTAVIIDQRRLGGGSRSTVGTVTEINSSIRLLFSRLGEPSAGYSDAYAFNLPEGMCPRCGGIGTTREADPDRLVDWSLSLRDGALLHPTQNVDAWPWRMYATYRGVASHRGPLDVPVGDWSAATIRDWLYAEPTRDDDFEGLITRFNRLYIHRSPEEVSERYLRAFDAYSVVQACPLCRGARLSQAALASRINGRNIADWYGADIYSLREEIARLAEDPVAAPLVAEADTRLARMEALGLGYLTLDRPTSTLSGGESQRIKMVRHLGSSLVELMYVFDEPTVGLHPRDVHQIVDLMAGLRDRGNTVLVVEHDRDTILAADHIVDIGPGAGGRGGTLVHQGDVASLLASDSITGRQLAVPPTLKETVRAPTGWRQLRGVTANNLRGLDADIPEGVLTVLTGVAGSGKSTLVRAGLMQLEGTWLMDQSPIGGNIRSCPATYTGAMDHLRAAFAAESGESRSLFSFNTAEGACPNCDGRGVISTDLAFLDPVITVCEVCEGSRYRPEVLAHRVEGHTIADILAMTAEQAAALPIPAVARRAQTMVDVGLEYLTLGQPLNSLSGGEAQRIKLSAELQYRGQVYVLDEPTTGLHMANVGQLMALLNRMTDAGNTIVVVEHNLDVIAQADWVIDLGPDAGNRGGEVVFAGTPRDLAAADTHTGRHLAAALRPAR